MPGPSFFNGEDYEMTSQIENCMSNSVAYLITATHNGESVQAIAAVSSSRDVDMTEEEREKSLLEIIKPYADDRFGEGVDFKLSWDKSTPSPLKMDS